MIIILTILVWKKLICNNNNNNNNNIDYLSVDLVVKLIVYNCMIIGWVGMIIEHV